MTDYERHMPPTLPHQHDFGASVRMVMQGLILAGILWLASTVSTQNASIAGMQVQLVDLKDTLSGVPAMKDRITVLEQKQTDMMRRLEVSETRMEHTSATAKIGGWTR